MLPLAVKVAQSGLYVNELKHEVIVDGKKIDLTQTEFKLLLYLFTHASQLCKRADILRDVFNITTPNDQTERGLLNTTSIASKRRSKPSPINPNTSRQYVGKDINYS